MASVPRRATPARYAFRVGAHLNARWSIWFDGFTVALEPDGTTTLSGVVRDQTHLHGLLSKIRDLGVDLVHVEVLDAPRDDEGVAT